MHREALQLNKDSLATLNRTLPENHPQIATIMNNLAASYLALGMHREALRHPDIAQYMGNIALSYSALGMHREALQLEKDTLIMLKKTLPEEHPQIATSINNLTESYSALGMHREALQLQKDTLFSAAYCCELLQRRASWVGRSSRHCARWTSWMTFQPLVLLALSKCKNHICLVPWMCLLKSFNASGSLCSSR
jgi:tetratricopeptide (TPR) repeat protein